MSGLELPERPADAPDRAADTTGDDRPWSAWWAVPIAIGAVVVASTVYLVAALIHDKLVETPVHQGGTIGVALRGAPPALTFASTLAQGLALVGGSVLAAAASLRGRFSATHLGLRPARPFPSAAFVVAGYLAFLLVSALWLSATGITDRENIPIQLGTRDSTAALVLAVLLTSVVAPIAEELFFRGFLFGGLRKHGLVVAALVSGTAFGLAHVASAPIGFIVPLATLGVILALVYERTGSIYAAMALHALNNAIAFGTGDGRGWLVAVGLAASALSIFGVSRLARGHHGSRTVVPIP